MTIEEMERELNRKLNMGLVKQSPQRIKQPVSDPYPTVGYYPGMGFIGQDSDGNARYMVVTEDGRAVPAEDWW